MRTNRHGHREDTTSSQTSGLTAEQLESINRGFQHAEIEGNYLKFTTNSGDVILDITDLITDIKVNGATFTNQVLTLHVEGGADVTVDLSQFITHQELQQMPIDYRLAMYLPPPNARLLLERGLATPRVFNSFYNIAEIDPGNPFAGGANSESVTSEDNSPLGLPYETYTCRGNISFILHMGVNQGFSPVPGRSYQISIIARGVGDSVGRNVTMGVVRERDRLENTVTLPEYWSILQTEAYLCTSRTFVVYVHIAERGGNMRVGEQIEVMAYYVREL